MRLRVPDEGETVVRDVIRGESALREPAARRLRDRARGPHAALQLRGRRRRHRHGHHARGARRGPPLQHARASCWCWRRWAREPPLYAHLPLLHGTDGKPLSKRHGAASVQELREIGYLPEAVRNYLALLGWGYDAETTFFTTEELIEKFSLERVSRSPAVFDEQKLSLDERPLHPRDGHGRADAPRRGVDGARATSRARTTRASSRPSAAVKDKVSTLAEVPRLVGFAFGPVETDQKAWDKVMSKDGARDLLERARDGAGGRGALRRGADRAGAPASRGGDRSQARSRLPAPPRGDHGQDRLGRDLREPGPAGPRRGARAGSTRARPALSRAPRLQD